MKHCTPFFFTVLVAFFAFAPLSADARNVVMTYNVGNYTEKEGPRNWEGRKAYLLRVVRSQDPDIVGMQEPIKRQVNFFVRTLDGYGSVGVGRRNGLEKGEFNPILYKKREYSVLKSGTFWLSKTPGKPSFGWNADHKRIVTWAKMKNRRTMKVFYVFNTHFDKQKHAKRESARLLRRKASDIAGDAPVLIIGDFNARVDSAAYNILTTTFTDAKTLTQSKGPNKTFTNFEYAQKRLDYIFTSGRVNIHSYRTVNKKYHGRFPSDHHPVVSVATF